MCGGIGAVLMNLLHQICPHKILLDILRELIYSSLG